MSPSRKEAERQRALDAYRIVDTLPEAAYDDIVRIATLICDVPSALISLIDRDRQWFKARAGFALSEGRREEAFCNRAIEHPGQLMEVPDASADPRFANNPLVTGGPEILFYAGMPLTTPGGAPIGTVCVLDSEPRMINDAQREGLASLARLTMNLLEARRREIERERAGVLETAAAKAPAKPRQAPPEPVTLMLFEVQELAAAAQRQGERAVERALEQLHARLEALVAPGDSLSHSTGQAELIAVLHGAHRHAACDALRGALPAFEQEYGLRVLVASADSESDGERLDAVFQRADAALSSIKDAFRAQLAASRA